MLRISKIATSDSEFLKLSGDIFWKSSAKVYDGTIILERDAFKSAHTAIQRQVLRIAIERLIGNLKDIESRHIEDIIEILEKPAGKSINLPYGLVFYIDYDRYILGTDPAVISPFPYWESDFSLIVPGRVRSGKWIVTAGTIKPSEMKKTNRFTAYMDFDKTGEIMRVTTCRAGDRFHPLGMDQDKKVGKFMIDEHIPHDWRSRIPIVRSSKQILWIVGYRIDDRIKVTNGTKNVLIISFSKSRQ